MVRPVSAPTLRHSFATRPLESGSDIRTVQEPWVTRTSLLHPLMRIHALAALAHPYAAQIYTHVLNRGGHGVVSPLDR